MNNALATVSFDSEDLILVDPKDQPLGSASKLSVHEYGGQLHRAFSVFLFSRSGSVLLQQRSELKKLWPGYWSNACCSHPRLGESYEAATARRLSEELGVSVPLRRLFQFEYKAHYGDIGSEHELCSVYAGLLAKPIAISPHPEEVSEWGWFDCKQVDAWCENEPERFTPWFLMEWQRIRQDFTEVTGDATPPC